MENESGAAYVFVRNNNTWSQQAYLKASNTGNDDLFGASVSVSRDTIVVGADEESSNAVGINDPTGQADNSTYEAGAAYIFKRSNGIWKQYAYLKSSDTDARDYFGYSVAVSGSTVITGIYGEDSITSGINSIPNDAGTADDSGAAYIFTMPETVPPAVVKFTVTAKVNQPKFGKVTGAGRFNAASRVTLKAMAAKGHTFIGWYEKKKLISKQKVLVIKVLKANHSIIGNFK